MKRHRANALLLAFLLLCPGSALYAQGTAFTYQDRLNNDGFYVDRIGTSPLELQLAAKGALGLGIEPQAKLHLYEPNNSVSQRIQTGGGVNAWTRLELVNANGQWDIGTSRSFNGDQLYFSRSGAGIALGLQPNGDAQLAGNVNVGGNATQARDKGGFVKAMAKVNADGSVARCYNGQTGASTGNCGFTVNHDGVGNYNVLFGFQVTDRFASMTAHGYNGTFYYGPNVNGLLVYTYYTDGSGPVNCPFTLIVY